MNLWALRARRTGRMARRCLVPAAVLLTAGACRPRDPHADAIEHGRRLAQAFMEASGVPGLQVAVGIDGKLVWSEAFGLARVNPPVPATTTSRFRIASISKLLTGTLAAKLADAGQLDLDRPVATYVPGLPDAWRDITPRMLVHHTSGIGHYTDAADGLDTTTYSTTQEALSRFRDRPLVHAPGQAATYSSYAYTLLALAIEHAAGRPFLDVMHDELLAPLQMVHTGPDLASSPPPERTGFYDLVADSLVQESPFVNLSGRWAGSGYLSTAEDLVRFGLAHTGPGVLPAGTIALLQQRQELPDGSWTPEAFGWGPRDDWDGRALLWGDGGTPGARGGLLVYPKDGIAIAILTNLRGAPLERGEFQLLARPFLAARDRIPAGRVPDEARGEWSGSLSLGERELGVRLSLPGGSGQGRVVLEGWRSLAVTDGFQLGATTWLAAMDRKGALPFSFTMKSRDTLSVTSPRTGWTFTLTRVTTEAPLAPASDTAGGSRP